MDSSAKKVCRRNKPSLQIAGNDMKKIGMHANLARIIHSHRNFLRAAHQYLKTAGTGYHI